MERIIKCKKERNGRAEEVAGEAPILKEFNKGQ